MSLADDLRHFRDEWTKVGIDTTHYDGCWREHAACEQIRMLSRALAVVEAAEAYVDADAVNLDERFQALRKALEG